MLVDSHCHLDVEQFDADRDQVIRHAQQVGIGLIVNPGIDLQHCRQALALAHQHSMVYAAVGIHPNSSDSWSPETAAEVAALAADAKVVAYGEIGLDYYWDKVPRAAQQRAFEEQLALAARLGLPVLIHNRDATEDVTAILAAWTASEDFRRSPLARRPFTGVLHAFGGSYETAQAAYGWNFVLSLGGPVTFKNAHRLHTLVPQLDPERLMLETDAPYLTPHPHRGRRNEPAYITLVCTQLARLMGQTEAGLAAATTTTALRFFGLEDVISAPVQETLSVDSDALKSTARQNLR